MMNRMTSVISYIDLVSAWPDIDLVETYVLAKTTTGHMQCTCSLEMWPLMRVCCMLLTRVWNTSRWLYSIEIAWERVPAALWFCHGYTCSILAILFLKRRVTPQLNSQSWQCNYLAVIVIKALPCNILRWSCASCNRLIHALLDGNSIACIGSSQLCVPA